LIHYLLLIVLYLIRYQKRKLQVTYLVCHTLSSYNAILFLQFTLDYVTREYEAILPCPPIKADYFYSSNKQQCTKSKRRRYQDFNHSGLPSPPLSSSPERKCKQWSSIDFYPSPPLQEPMVLRHYIESVVNKSRIDTGTLLTSLSYARRLKSKLSHTSKGRYPEQFTIMPNLTHCFFRYGMHTSSNFLGDAHHSIKVYP
jgi:hypothetical protein